MIKQMSQAASTSFDKQLLCSIISYEHQYKKYDIDVKFNFGELQITIVPQDMLKSKEEV